MKIVAKAFVLTASIALSSSMALADCAQDLAALEAKMGADSHEGIAKDGSLAPLQKQAGEAYSPTSNDKTATENAQAGEAAADKEPVVAPTDSATSDPAGADSAQAMSGQDAQSQQSGGMTAAQQADEPTGDSSSVTSEMHAEALTKARTALEAGDEAACMKALEGLS